jgi:rod shape-determining protein MreC
VVLLISDESCKVSAAVEGTREQGIVSGERTSGGGVPVIGLQFLTKQANLKAGMRVYTSGLGGVFPAGILLGTVNQYRVRELDGFASLVSAVDLMTLQDVFVVIGEK